MKLGIDFGTNRTVIAAVDRGNYPLVCFEALDGTAPDWYPSLVAVRGDERRCGWEAWDLQVDPSWTVVRSVKRLLEDAGPETLLDLGAQKIRIVDLLHGFTEALAASIRESSKLANQAG
ncbi:MAG: hypothetical protein M3Y72_09700 [Acidobacteriota bacterium]|nr:hypothetical protein [Acidobacteriota bacterium]